MQGHDIETIVQSVLRDYGVAMTIQEIGSGSGFWNVVLRQRSGTALRITLGPNSPHGFRRAVMRALDIDGQTVVAPGRFPRQSTARGNRFSTWSLQCRFGRHRQAVGRRAPGFGLRGSRPEFLATTV
jgi:hypothetical protein